MAIVESADLLATLTGPCLMKVGLKITTTTGTPQCEISQPMLILKQDDGLIPNRTTATYISIPWGYFHNNTAWQSYPQNEVDPHIDQFDGVIECFFEACMHKVGGGTAQARLFDVTTNTVVPDSQLSTSSASYTYIRSGLITLTAGHRYIPQYRNSNVLYSMNSYYANIIIKAKNYTKIGAIIYGGLQEPNDNETPPFLFTGYGNSSKDDIVAADSLLFELDSNWIIVIEEEENTTEIELYNVTDGALVSGTYHTFTGLGTFYEFNQDIITCPDDADILVMECLDNKSGIKNTFLWAFMTELFPAPDVHYADQNQPSGFHCFMRQFLRNIKDGYIPYLTPDGVNKCW
jgi:hypothetical protein